MIHGHNRGTAIRDYIWKSIERDLWHNYVHNCPIPDLMSYLGRYDFDKTAHIKKVGSINLASNGMRRKSETVWLGAFVFRSGSTTLPILM